MPFSRNRCFSILFLFCLSAIPLRAAQIRQLAHSTIDSETAAGPTIPAAFSASGRYLLLRSVAPNLIAGQVDENGAADLFLRDRESGTTTLISHRAGAPAHAGDQGSMPKAMTPDGEWVLYTSWASDLVAGIEPSAFSTDVYLWRRSTGENRLVSHLAGQPLAAAGKSRAAALTSDGAFVLFESEAAGLAAGDTNLTTDVFLWSRASGNVTLISATPGGVAGNGASTATGLREDGLEIFFSSFATDLVPGDTNGREDGFVRDLVTASTSGPLAAAGARAHAVSANGRYLLLQSWTEVLLLDRRTGQLRTVSSSSAASPVALSADGSAVLFDLGSDAYLYRSATATATCLRCDEPPTHGLALADGGLALYLGPDSAGTQQVHLYDAATGISEPVTRQANGDPAPAGGYAAAMSADGRHFAFASRDAQLEPAVDDRNGMEDTFSFTRGEPGIELESRAGIAGPVATTRGLGSAPTGQSADGAEILFSGPADLLDPRQPDDATAAWAYHVGSGGRRLLSPLPGQPAIPAGAFSSPLALAQDGRVLLNSNAAGLVPGASPGLESQLYLYSPAAGGSYRLITARADAPLQGTSGYLTEICYDRQLSRTAFLSGREGLVAGVDPEGSPQLFICDLNGAGCALLSAAAGDKGRPADEGSTSLSASRDLETLIFGSRASDLVAAGAGSGRNNLYSWRQGGGVELLSRSAGSPGVEANEATWPADLSADGRFVLATSLATDLVPGLIDGNGTTDAFLFDSLAGTWELVSSGGLGLPANSRSQGVSISADGRFVLFMSAATDVVPGQIDDAPFYPPIEGPQDLFLLDRNTGEKKLITHLPGRPHEAAGYFYYFGSLSEDGSRVAYLSTSPRLLPGEPEGLISTWLWDGAGGEPQMLAASTGGPYLFPGAFPIFLETRFFDGSLLPLSSWSDNLLPGDNNGRADAYLILLDGLFRDGFESGDTGAWSATVP